MNDRADSGSPAPRCLFRDMAGKGSRRPRMADRLAAAFAVAALAACTSDLPVQTMALRTEAGPVHIASIRVIAPPHIESRTLAPKLLREVEKLKGKTPAAGRPVHLDLIVTGYSASSGGMALLVGARNWIKTKALIIDPATGRPLSEHLIDKELFMRTGLVGLVWQVASDEEVGLSEDVVESLQEHFLAPNRVGVAPNARATAVADAAQAPIAPSIAAPMPAQTVAPMPAQTAANALAAAAPAAPPPAAAPSPTPGRPAAVGLSPLPAPTRQASAAARPAANPVPGQPGGDIVYLGYLATSGDADRYIDITWQRHADVLGPIRSAKLQEAAPSGARIHVYAMSQSAEEAARVCTALGQRAIPCMVVLRR